MYEEKSSIRLDSYDFFGYLVPGSLVLLSMCFCILQIKFGLGISATCKTILQLTGSLTGAQFIALAVFFIIFSYIIGHLTSSISSFLFEKTIVGKVINYPYKSLILGISPDKKFSSLSYRAFISLFFLTIFLFVSGIQKPLWHINFNAIEYPVYLYCSTGTLLVILILLKFADDPLERLLPRIHKIFRLLLHSLFWIFGILFYTVERSSSHFFGQIKTFPQGTRDQIASKYKLVFGKELHQVLETEIFWSVYWHITSSNQYIRNKTDKWLILYGFMRNLSLSCVISAILIVLPTKFGIPLSTYTRIAGITLFFLAIIFSFRYYYIYFGYYSKTIFRAFAYLNTSPPPAIKPLKA